MNDTSKCAEQAGRVAPVIDRNRCEGKQACVEVCPFSVFEMGVISKQQRAVLSFRGKLKAWAHGGKQAFVVNPQSCHACNLCVDTCPENAISLAAVQ